MLGRRIIQLDPPQGFAAEASAAAILYVAGWSSAPDLDHSHDRLDDRGRRLDEAVVRAPWGLARTIVGAWVFTFPGAGLAAALVYWATHLVRWATYPLPMCPRQWALERPHVADVTAEDQPKRPEM